MFFVISGFLITSNAKRRWPTLKRVDYREFYALRFARVAPCLLLLLAVVNLFAAAYFACLDGIAVGCATALIASRNALLPDNDQIRSFEPADVRD